ncbi:MAG TPA: valine--tRNA ligase [Terriglobia bacterium]|nr:valine--tRNA ligase [Terriglobia bacterium]
MQTEIPKVYSPESIEPYWARVWVEKELYRPADDPSCPRFSLVIPPPNVTGSLHIGHMLEHTEIDILMRWHRMRGEDVLWLPGTDHASIATQMVVEQEIGREALPELGGQASATASWRREGRRLRIEMGRSKFLERCWQWKEQSGGRIRKQMERLGASVDWTRERFTMDAEYSRAVFQVFARLYNDGLIYRGTYIVNWCPRCGTAVSDLEVAHEERAGKLWYIRYPFEDGRDYITVATTRPETMLGDTAVAVNPKDERYRHAVGRRLALPLLKRVIPIVADEFVDPNFGTGAVKVTPAHDPNDFAIAGRHSLPQLKVLDEEARMTEAAGPYQGLDRYKARERILDDLRLAGLLEREEDYALSVGICSRCKTVVEPILSKQWFMKMQPLAGPAIRAVEEGRIRIVPENYRKIYLDWMSNIHDWCISRQLWWGHRIPVWTCRQCGEVIVSEESPATCPKCAGRDLQPETDVLDTWFSSALWPFATLGWPEDTADLRRYYPTDLMIMGFDILFFWGARMIMMGLKFMDDVPFRELYIHALVRDAERQKMSKTKGNVIDPLEVTEQYGTDAVRFALAISAAPGTDIAFSYDKIKSYRAFANKIWNASRFILMNLEKLAPEVRTRISAATKAAPENGFGPLPTAPTLALADQWMFSRLAAITKEIEEALADYRFHEASFKVYHFFWGEFCDWYLEWIKPEIARTLGPDDSCNSWANLLLIFESALHLLHPFMPFITEELWHRLPNRADEVSISLTPFALVSARAANPVAEKDFENIRSLVVAARNAKAESGLQKENVGARTASEDAAILDLFNVHRQTVLRLAGLESLETVSGGLEGGIPVTSAFEFQLVHHKQVDDDVERARLGREKEKLEGALFRVKKQLENRSFLDRAPEDVVRKTENHRAELEVQFQKVVESLERLG